ncbi:hypothetical protein ABB37_08327 [Leptomonas pyrrhocoris]|uniref:Helicase C-terminal domain-containing protein n=1 Tax=Leptomonas pyrrhocoris TaxID=157538 RepID=A0A0M9FTL5_LEPPY|nr:hypothetical protein ABB37_08327 [Leptomonas pyrrhocoris]XP_015654245.1 hypothetical protein ABB37_08327 [Leptomonas pyrrhocoris]XP_015654246.1 hypothetical protein ABB37_08327 [Leptomonas pyrrhocoris]KPA75805.1 hypothetical protein ABB37_08327 [Leptomonas pyrrhocoris]KPA75806.1 hypothetical protein ABB37_08327 [Leptomonas pyrrhocoris]KPA75807.1 hypothetical protein ABB37_08327 [Leptomonas pyrrhocoris]|eukprot:XP_015654244.1 hypothetical protein ABB37_08327 [Leptomonas pyrrhocoris]
MWMRWRRGPSRRLAPSPLHAARARSHALLVGPRNPNAVLSSTLLLRNRHEGPPADEPPAPSILSSGGATTAAASDATTKNDRTAELLRSIARRGGGAVRRTRPDGAASLFHHDASSGRKGAASRQNPESAASPLARLFAAPPPPPAASPSRQQMPFSPSPSAVSAPPISSTPSGQAASNAHPHIASDRSPPPSRALLVKLLLTIQQEKRVPWATVTHLHPEVSLMPLYASRDDWCAQIGAYGSAAPRATVNSVSSAAPPLFLCAAPTGTGKSVLLPLFAMDAHWAQLEQRLQYTLDHYDALVRDNGSEAQHTAEEDSATRKTVSDTSSALRPFALSSQAAFVSEFTACSRLCVVVSQPTRVACAELARYVSALLAGAARPAQLHEAAHANNPKWEGADKEDGTLRLLIGKRVGYAVGGEPRFCAESEVIYATPGYLLNALQLSSRTSPPSFSASSAAAVAALSPTTLMVDEAHCRDIETDALLAWVKLSRRLIITRHALRQYYVMSATMRLAAMDHYLSRSPSAEAEEDDGEQRRATVGGKGGHEAGSDAYLPILLLSPAQRQHVQQWWRRRRHTQQTPPAAAVAAMNRARSSRHQGDAPSTEDWQAQLQRDTQTRAAVLQLLEAAEGEVCNVGDGVSAVDKCGKGDAAVDDDEDRLPQGIVVATAPYRVERFFVDDLEPERGCFEQSHVLFDAAARRAAVTSGPQSSRSGHDESAHHGGGGAQSRRPRVAAVRFSQPSARPLPLCLTDEGRALRQHLAQTFSTRPSSYNLFVGQSRLLASFVLEVMQAARQRWVPSSSSSSSRSVFSTSTADAPAGSVTHDPSSTSSSVSELARRGAEARATAPVTVLLFVAGISEMHQLLQSLERLCEKVQQQQQQFDSGNAHSTSKTPVDILRSGSEVFSVGLLHSSAVGNPQEQLTATEQTGAPLRLLLATNVAESSLTIANTRVVIDTCLERRALADETTGTTRLQTAFVSPSGLRQRCGRVGRTADGVVIHMAPRHYVLPPAERTMKVGGELTAPGHTQAGDHAQSATLALEPLEDGVVTVLLHVKYFFPNVAAALAALPSPPTAAEVRVALQQLVDMELLVLPEVTSTQKTDKEGKEEESHCTGDDNGTAEQRKGGSSLAYLLNQSSFTTKGLLVASLPLPYEHASLVYHAFQFLCVEDAVLMACAMAVPSLFAVPRVTAHSLVRIAARKLTNSDFTWSHTPADAKPALSPLESFYKRLWVQRDLAGFSCPSLTMDARDRHNSKDAKAGLDGAGRVGHLSEPLLLRAVLRRWYALSSVTDAGPMLSHFSLNRSALRQVDCMVGQCCSRLISLLLPLQRRHGTALNENGLADDAVGAEGEGEEKDFGSYVCASTSSTTLPFVEDWSDGLQEQLLRSLRRLRRAAHSRVQLRQSVHRYRAGLPQWYDSEDRYIRLCSRPYVRNATPQQQPRYPPHTRRLRQQRHTKMTISDRRKTGGDETVAEDKDVEGEGEGAEQQREQQQAVRRHPSFAYWGPPPQQPDNGGSSSLSVAQPYPSLVTSEVRLIGKTPTTTGASAASLAVAPPPIQTRLNRARSPVYRPPPPPPVMPSVAFLLGRTEDRLCAAFVAAFGHRTLRGEDGGHRFHHRRLVRNLQALQQDPDHVCTFHIDVQASPQLALSGADAPADDGGRRRGGAGKTARAGPLSHTSSMSYEDLAAAGVTPHDIRAALESYLAGAGLQQVEVFQSNRLAVAARFASSGFDGLQLRSTGTTSTSVVDKAVEGDEAEADAVDANFSDAAGRHVWPSGTAQRPDYSSTCAADEGTSVSTVGAEEAPAAAATAAGSGATPTEDLSAADLLRPIPLSSMRVKTSLARQQELQQEQNADHEGGAIPLRHASSHPSPSPTERVPAGNPYVQLAPFGASLLIAAVSGSGGGGGGGVGGLQRLPLRVAAPARVSPTLTSSSDNTAALAAANTSSASTTPETEAEAKHTTHAAPADLRHSAAALVPRGPRFSNEASAGASVSWTDTAGTCSRSLKRDDCAALGLADLFPSPVPPPSPSIDAAHRSSESDRGDGGHTDLPSSLADSVPCVSAPPPSVLTLSVVPPVYTARSVMWKVPLATAITLAPPTASPRTRRSKEGADAAARSFPSHQRASRTSLQYCVLCQRLCGSRRSFEQHCRSGSHLEHLYQAVALGLTRLQLEQLYGYASAQAWQGNDTINAETTAPSSSLSALADAAMPLLSLLSLDSSHRASSAASSRAPPRLLAQQIHPCVIHPLSFLNCLQWTPRRTTAPSSSISAVAPSPFAAAAANAGAGSGFAEVGNEEADRATPLAVAGSLMAMQTTLDIIPPAHQRRHPSSSSFGTAQTASALRANGGSRTSGSAPVDEDAALPSPATVAASTLSVHHVWVLDVSSRCGPPSAPSPPPMSLLFVIAGYLAAASPQAMVALLFNATHSDLHGVMLYGLGVWKLPEPLPMRKYAGVLEHIGRGGGWPGVLVPVGGREPPPRQQQLRTHDGLHWCVPTGVCQACAPSAVAASSVAPPAGTPPSAIGTSTVDDLQKHWPTVEATILLTLHEYLHAQRNMVTLADYVERVLCKLQLSPFVAASASSATTITTTRSATAARLLAHFMTHARSGQGIQSLLRDVGCLFLTPPHALSALLRTDVAPAAVHVTGDRSGDSGGDQIHGGSCSSTEGRRSAARTTRVAVREDGSSLSSDASSAWSKRLSQRALAAEGATIELMFTVPPALPSLLPPVDFADRLRSFYEARHAERRRRRAKEDTTPTTTDGRSVNGSSTAQPTRGAAGHPWRSRRRVGGDKWDDRMMF